jgi:glycosyltransferase involved in cell wall biosynthesis
MQNIQIICVNDGSPGNSRAILQEYADKDSRIEIIDKPNGGPTSARYAAYPHLRGKHTLFVDADDWIELDLCEKTYRKAEENHACMTMFFSRREGGTLRTPPVTGGNRYTIEEKGALFAYPGQFYLWCTDFLLENKIHYPEVPGLLAGEDNLPHWKAVVLAKCVTVIPERLFIIGTIPIRSQLCVTNEILGLY